MTHYICNEDGQWLATAESLEEAKGTASKILESGQVPDAFLTIKIEDGREVAVIEK